MLNFRKKILLGDLALFLLFFFVIYFSKGTDIGMLGFGTIILLVYILMTTVSVLRFSRPIQHILDAIAPYQEEKVEYLPRIAIPVGQSEEFNKLATTLNSLTEKIRKQIESLKVQRKETEGDFQLTINDLGIGIPEMDLPHIFNRFYTVDKARSRKFGGSGLGLSIVKTIVDKLKGKIVVTSELKKGTGFTLTFSPADSLSFRS